MVRRDCHRAESRLATALGAHTELRSRVRKDLRLSANGEDSVGGRVKWWTAHGLVAARLAPSDAALRQPAQRRARPCGC